MRRALAFIAIGLLAGCAAPSDTAEPDENVLGNAGVAMDIDTIGAENMETPANLSEPVEGVAVGPNDARSVVKAYFDALSAGRYAQAYALLDPATTKMSSAAFAASFARYSSYSAEIGIPGRVDAGAGQRYVTVPVRVTSTLADGDEPVGRTENIVLHRVANIDGATAAQRHWRIREVSDRPAPQAADAGPAARYRCDDDSSFSVAFDESGDRAMLTMPGETPVVLASQRPASGIWYAGDRWELRGKGREAVLTRPDSPPAQCRTEQVTQPRKGDEATDPRDGSGGRDDAAEGDQPG